jgi:phosphomannomutase
LRVMVEGKSEENVRHWAETLAAVVRESAAL